MTEIEKKAEEYATDSCNEYYGYENYKTEYFKYGDCQYECLVRWEASKQAYKDGYEQGQKENELLKSKIKNVYEVRQKVQSEIIIELEIEIEELKETVTEYSSVVEKMKNCGNCSKILVCECRNTDEFRSVCDNWELAE